MSGLPAPVGHAVAVGYALAARAALWLPLAPRRTRVRLAQVLVSRAFVHQLSARLRCRVRVDARWTAPTSARDERSSDA